VGEAHCCSDGEAFFLSDKRKKEILTIDVDKLTGDVINQLHKSGKVTRQQRQDLFKSMYQPLKEGVNEGFGKVQVQYGKPDVEMLKQLQTNTAIFSIFKSHAYVKETAALLKDASGNLRPKDEFIREALKLDNTYRKNYLDAEYDTAVRASRMATIWMKAQSIKDLYPNLEYIASRATHPRKDHEKYYGIVLPIDDPFWNTHMPPNGWRCQCSVQPTDKVAEDVPHDLPPVEGGFTFNPGKTGQVYDIKNSEYIKTVPDNEQPALIKEAKKFVDREFIDEVDYDDLYKSKSGGNVQSHPLTYDNGDFNEVLKAARQLANIGEKVKMLPDVQDAALRKKLQADGAKGNKNPDYLINEKFATDLKIVSTPTLSAVKDAISRCHKQCNNIALQIDDDNSITSQQLQRAIKGQLKHDAYNDFENLWIYFRGHWKQFTRKEILDGEWF